LFGWWKSSLASQSPFRPGEHNQLLYKDYKASSENRFFRGMLADILEACGIALRFSAS